MFEKISVAVGILVLAVSAGTAAAQNRELPDEAPVRSVLDRYVSAYERLDVKAAKAVWPSVDEKALGRAFAELESQALNFTDCRISMGTGRAAAYCSGTAVFVPKVGNRQQHLEYREWTFEVKKTGEQWTITQVDVR